MRKEVMDHLGKKYNSKADMCRAWKVNVCTFSDRIERGWSLEEALTGNKNTKNHNSKKITDCLGEEFDSIADMCKEYGITYSAFKSRKARGWTLKEILMGKENSIKPNSKECCDHLGNCYPSASEMCRVYNISYEIYRSRKKLGWTVEEIINGKRQNSRIKEQRDHLGNVYKSESSMCKKYGVNRNTYRQRIKNGWTVEEALTNRRVEPVVKQNQSKNVEDHLGNKYYSIKEMCAEYGVNSTTFNTRIKAGYTLEEALTGIDKETSKGIKQGNCNACKDHLGNEFDSETQMCRYYNINYGTFKSRTENLGWSIKDALTKPSVNYVYDHLNNKFETARAMCAHYGVRFDVFYRRRKLGWSVEEALTDSREHTIPMAIECQDHMGNVFKSYSSMCRRWKVDPSVFKDRIRLGWSVEEALTIPKNYSLGEYRVSTVLNEFCEKKIIETYYHNITIKKTFEYLGMEKEYNEYLSIYEKELIGRGVSVSKKRLAKFRFDFTLINHGKLFAFIEFDGKQHFYYVDVFFKTLSEFLYRHNSDIAKNVFSESNKIPLLRIRYDQDDMKTIKYMINDLIRSPHKYVNKHNTFMDENEYMSVFNNQFNNVFLYV